MMLDLIGLPKNINGFRTTHTCELCGFEPKTKNKYREKQDHLVMKHFKERIDKIFPHCRPYSCPSGDCSFTGKDKQALLRHYTGKHGILEKYLREALAEKGINYAPNENGKRRHSEVNGNGGHGKGHPKNPRLSLTPPGGLVHSPTSSDLHCEIMSSKPVIVASRPNTEELRKEVEAMMRSFQPMEQQQVVIHSVNGFSSSSLPVSSSSSVITNGHHHHHHNSVAPVAAVVTAIPVMETTSISNGTIVATASSGNATVVPVASLPSIVLSAVANATAASVAAAAARVSLQLPMQPSNVPTITVSTGRGQHRQQQQQQAISVIVSKNVLHGPSLSSVPLPMEIITNGGVESILPDLKGGGHHHGPSSPVVENEDVMWSAASHNGPAVVVEAAHYIDGVEAINFAAAAATIENIDYDYLYPVTTSSSSDVRERQLDFCML